MAGLGALLAGLLARIAFECVAETQLDPPRPAWSGA